MDKEISSDESTRGKNVWHWDDMQAEEDLMWANNDPQDDAPNGNDHTQQNRALTFDHIDSIGMLLDVAGGDEDLCKTKLLEIVPDTPFTDVGELAAALQEVIGYIDCNDQAAGSDDMVLLNLLYAPYTSRLSSLMHTLVRIENVGQICAWTKVSNISRLGGHTPMLGCPPIDLVELPRLKLAFTARLDDMGQLRLFSVDHADLFISNERNHLTTAMLDGLPHSLVMSTLQGEMQVLLPVVKPVRPSIKGEPFSTSIVLDRNDKSWNLALSQRYFLYPVHVSLAFLMTKGFDTALYLMLCRFLHRDYEAVFRLVDSIATDSKLSLEGSNTFKALSLTNDDWHPDAHAIRLKISLVTLNSDAEAPWDITTQAARHALKLDRVSANCRLRSEEELQLLENPLVVTSEKSEHYKPKLHTPYEMALVSNRKAALAAILEAGNADGAKPIVISCSVPPRLETKAWPFYTDNTVFMETCGQVVEVLSQVQWREVLEGPKLDKPLQDHQLLTMVMFHVLWDDECTRCV